MVCVYQYASLLLEFGKGGLWKRGVSTFLVARSCCAAKIDILMSFGCLDTKVFRDYTISPVVDYTFVPVTYCISSHCYFASQLRVIFNYTHKSCKSARKCYG